MSALVALMLLLHPFSPPAVYSGIASWYADPRAPQGSLYAAVPGYNHHPYYLTVHRGTRSVRVKVIDSCGCLVHTSHPRVIDLSWSAYKRLAPLSSGLTRVVIER